MAFTQGRETRALDGPCGEVSLRPSAHGQGRGDARSNTERDKGHARARGDRGAMNGGSASGTACHTSRQPPAGQSRMALSNRGLQSRGLPVDHDFEGHQGCAEHPRVGGHRHQADRQPQGRTRPAGGRASATGLPTATAPSPRSPSMPRAREEADRPGHRVRWRDVQRGPRTRAAPRRSTAAALRGRHEPRATTRCRLSARRRSPNPWTSGDAQRRRSQCTGEDPHPAGGRDPIRRSDVESSAANRSCHEQGHDVERHMGRGRRDASTDHLRTLA